MANIPVFVFIGNSNMSGEASLADVPLATFQKWNGSSATLPSTYPYSLSVPGVRMLTPKMPYGTSSDYAVLGASGTTVQVDTASTATVDQWVMIASGTGAGQYRRITALGTTALTDDTFTVSAWATNPDTTSVARVLESSHTANTGSSTTSLVTTTSFSGSLVGKFVVALSGTNAGYARRISAATSSTLTVDYPFFVAISAGTGFAIMDGTGAVEAIAGFTSTNCALRDMTFAYDNAYSYTDGFAYPNFISYCQSSPYNHKASLRINHVPETMWQLRQQFSEQPVGVHVAVDASSMAPQYISTVAKILGYSWLYDVDHLDFQPSSVNGLYQRVIDSLTATKALIEAEGNTMDLQGFFVTLAELDSQTEARSEKAGENMRLIRDSLRAAVSENGWSLQSGDNIPWCMTDTQSENWPYRDTVNAALQQIADDDPMSDLVSTSDLTYEVDEIHFDAAGHIVLGGLLFESWLAMTRSRSDSARLREDLPTLSSLRTKVKRRYERTVTSNDSTTTQIDMFVNDALREVYNELGDNAWFLRRMETLTISGTFPGTATLPRNVKQILKIENSACPGQSIVWKGLGYTDQGRVQISLHDYTGGPYVAHYIQIPQDLEKDSDIALIPNDFVEMVVMLACKRLAESSGNVSIAQYYATETMRLWKTIKRATLRYDRFRQGQLTVADGFSNWRNGPGDDPLWGL